MSINRDSHESDSMESPLITEPYLIYRFIIFRFRKSTDRTAHLLRVLEDADVLLNETFDSTRIPGMVYATPRMWGRIGLGGRGRCQMCRGTV